MQSVEIKGKAVVILVQRSRRPRRWAGVAMFAAVLIAVLCVEHRAVTRPSSAEASNSDASGHDSFESVLQRTPSGAVDHSAQWTDLALSSSTSTEGATPTR